MIDEKKEVIGDLRRLLIKLALIILVVFLAGRFVLGVHINRGNHMYPFIMDGDLVITYKLDRIRIGDAVVYQDPISEKSRISRVIAKDKSRIIITDSGQIAIDGYTAGENIFYETKPLEGAEISYPFQLSDGTVFLLDDFRTGGKDSRIFGGLPKDRIQGKIVYVIRRRGI